MKTGFGGSPDWQEHWALQLLREKGHSVGSTACWAGIIKTDVDGVQMTPGDAVRVAARYSEWPDRERRYLDYLQSLQAGYMRQALRGPAEELQRSAPTVVKSTRTPKDSAHFAMLLPDWRSATGGMHLSARLLPKMPAYLKRLIGIVAMRNCRQ